MNFFQKPMQPAVKPKNTEGCKIKIKNTKSGKTIEFSGACSKEQIQMAKNNLEESGEVEEDDF